MPAPNQPPKKTPPAAPQAPRENTLEELRYLQQIYQNQYVTLANDINDRLEALRNFTSTQQTLENVDTVVNKNLLLGLGGGAYANGKIIDQKSFVISIGAGFMIEKDIAGAKAYVAKAIDRSTQNINRLNKSKKDLENAIIEVSYKIEELLHQR